MPLATWKDLCLDAVDLPLMTTFWSRALGLAVETSERNVSLEGETDRHRVWINEVDRPRTVKNRLHPDIYAASIDDLVALGATVSAPAEETGYSWTVMADPEGNDFCAFLRGADVLPAYRLHGIGIDSVDSEALARWWGEVFGIAPTREAGDGWWTITGAGPDDVLTLDFAPVPEPRTVPNRMHWDVTGDVDDLLAAGATHLWDTERWVVLADPEGNEFCVFDYRHDA